MVVPVSCHKELVKTAPVRAVATVLLPIYATGVDPLDEIAHKFRIAVRPQQHDLLAHE